MCFSGLLIPLNGDEMIQSSHLAGREEFLQSKRCTYSRDSLDLDHVFDAMLPPELPDNLSPSPTFDMSTDRPSDKDLQRANGSCRIVLDSSEKGTRIMDVYQQFPMRVLFPRADGGTVKEAVLVNISGGIAGGDQLECSVTVLDNASIAVTSQAAEKIYRALDEPARIKTSLKASDSGKLAWLPQETIVFNRARINRETEIEVSAGTELLALEWLVLGRRAHGERMDGGQITDSWRVKKDGKLVWADNFHVTDEVFPHLSRKALLSDCSAVATLVYFGPDLDTRLQVIRDVIQSSDCQCGATLVGGLIVARFAAKASYELRVALRNVLQQFNRELGPGPSGNPNPFGVPKMWSC